MNQDNIKRLKDIVSHACDLPVADRKGYLTRNCQNDPEMLSEALELIVFSQPDTDELFLNTPTLLPDMVGNSVGNYRIVEEIGEGGMGIVYLAEQARPLKRQVALKIIKFGMDTREVIRRFDSERQSLAMMNHPNIASVFEAGATADGRPYFIMEYLPGVPITTYCETHNLGLKDRLILFEQVCRAINHAHQKGVIHRDIKPNNLLIIEHEGRAIPKVIDFGVAKAIDRDPAEIVAVTQVGRLIGTTEYMSPEQADVSTPVVDTRSDIYSLGVVLYELLTSSLPVNLRPWPKNISGDLGCITMKALESEPNRRYSSSAALADDIKRHLMHEPVEARPPGSLYRFKKFVRRHRVSVVTSLLVLVALIAGTIGTTIGMIRARQAEQEAIAAADRSEAGLLFQTSRAETVAWKRLSYLIRALELDYRPQYRRLLQKVIGSGPTLFRLPAAEDSHNPSMGSFSPDGRWMAVGWGKNGTIQLYDTDTGEKQLLHGHSQAIHAVKFSPDSCWLVTAGTDSTFCLWSAAEATRVRCWQVDGAPCPFWSKDGQHLIVGVDNPGSAMSWQSYPLDGSDPEELGSSGPPTTAVISIPFMDLDSSRRWLALPVGKQLELYDMTDLANGPVRIIGRHESTLISARFSPNGEYVLGSDATGYARLWNLAEPEQGPVREFPVVDGSIIDRFDYSGGKLARGGAEGVQIWDLTLPDAAEPVFLDSGSMIFNGSFSSDGNWIVTTGTFRHVGVWPLNRNLPITLNLETDGSAQVAFSPDGRWLITASDQGLIQGWPLAADTIKNPIKLHQADNYGFFNLRFDDASRYVFASVCNSAEGVGTITRISLGGDETKIWDGATCSIKVDGTGRYVASDADPALRHSHVQLFDTVTGTQRVLDQPNGGSYWAVGFLNDGRLLACGPAGMVLWNTSDNGYERLGDAPDWAELALDRETICLVEGPTGVIYRQKVDGSNRECLNQSFSSERIYTTSLDSLATRIVAVVGDGTVEMIDTNKDCHYRLPVFDTITGSLAVDPYGRWIATSAEGVVKLIPIPTEPTQHDRPLDQYLTTARGLTNLRVVRDEKSPNGYRMESGTLPDLVHPPSMQPSEFR